MYCHVSSYVFSCQFIHIFMSVPMYCHVSSYVLSCQFLCIVMSVPMYCHVVPVLSCLRVLSCQFQHTVMSVSMYCHVSFINCHDSSCTLSCLKEYCHVSFCILEFQTVMCIMEQSCVSWNLEAVILVDSM